MKLIVSKSSVVGLMFTAAPRRYRSGLAKSSTSATTKQ